MSTYTFVDQLIGLAREFKKKQRRAHSGYSPSVPPEFGAQISQRMAETGYFDEVSTQVFTAGLQLLLERSKPTYKAKR